jgi:hypothetical protein
MANYKADTLAPGTAFMDNGGSATCEFGITTPSAALALNDTVDLVRVAGGTKLVKLETWNGDLDTGTTLQGKIGYRKCNTANAALSPADDDDYFLAAGAFGQAAVLASAPTRYAFVPLTFNEDVFITLTVTAAATGVSGTPSISCLAEGIARGIK